MMSCAYRHIISRVAQILGIPDDQLSMAVEAARSLQDNVLDVQNDDIDPSISAALASTERQQDVEHLRNVPRRIIRGISFLQPSFPTHAVRMTALCHALMKHPPHDASISEVLRQRLRRAFLDPPVPRPLPIPYGDPHYVDDEVVWRQIYAAALYSPLISNEQAFSRRVEGLVDVALPRHCRSLWDASRQERRDLE